MVFFSADNCILSLWVESCLWDLQISQFELCPCLRCLEEFRWKRWFHSIFLELVLCQIKRELIRLQESSQNTFVKWQYEWNSQIQSHNVTAPKYELWTCDNCSGPIWSIMLHPLQMITVHYIQPHFWTNLFNNHGMANAQSMVSNSQSNVKTLT